MNATALAVAGAAAAALSAAPAADGVAAQFTEPARILLIAPTEPGNGSELAGRLVDLLQDAVPGGIEIERADAFAPDELFRLDRSDAGRPTAWVVVGETIARLRAAGAGRARFVFRDLAISRPLTELDRERVGQMLKVALAAVIDGGPGVIGRGDARVALGISATPVGAEHAGLAARAPVGAPARAPERAVEFSLGGFYKIQHTELGFTHGPGIVAAVESTRLGLRPGGWLSLQYDLPQEMTSDGSVSLPVRHAVALRGGVSLAPLSWVHVDVGGGIDVQRLARENTWTVESYYSPPIVPVFRLATRLGPAPLSAFRVSATASVEIVRTSVVIYEDPQFMTSTFTIGGDQAFAVRPGLAIEIWWL